MTRLTATILSAVLPILFLAAFGCRPKTANTNDANLAVNAVVQTNQTGSLQTTNVSATNTAQPVASTTEQELRRFALSFTERYGSYSNQTNFANLENLLIFMTDDFAGATRSFIAQERGKNRDTAVYYGITTKAAAVQTVSFSESKSSATFSVETLRREAIGSTSNVRNYQQSVLVVMKQEDGVWKIASADWQ